MSELNPDWVSPPCDTILEILKGWGLSQDAAFEAIQEKLELSDNLMGDFILGDFPLRPGMAKTLETWLGSTQEFWLKLDANFQKQKRRIKAAKDFVNQARDIYANEGPSEGLDEIFSLRSTLEQGNFAYVELIMRDLTRHPINPPSMGGCLLVVTKPYEHEFHGYREDLYEATFKRYEENYGLEHAERTLGPYKGSV